MSEKRYQIISTTDEHGIGPRDENGKPRLRVTMVGELTEEEFGREFGDRMRITEMMCLETDDLDGYTIHVLLTDVLASENEHSHQEVLVRGLMESGGMEPLEHQELLRRARSYDDITPDAARFLLNCAGGGMHPEELDDAEIANQAMSNGFSLKDFLREE